MGLLSALNNAVSGLNVNQQNLNVLSHNISNANTPNYSKQVVNQQANYIAGADSGTSVASISRQVNQYLVAQVQTQTSVNTGNTTLTDYYAQIQNLLGQPGNNSGIDNAIATFFSAVQTMANSPSSSAATNVVDAAQAAASKLSGLATGLQTLRLQSDTDITSAVTNINSDLQNLFKNNAAIEQANATNQNTNGLLDERDALITDLSGYLNINTNIQADGTMQISTSGGVSLLTNTTYGQLSHSSANSTSTFVNNGTIDDLTVSTLDQSGHTLGAPVQLATGGTSSSITTLLSGGKLQSLMQMRDKIIPNILSQLDQLAGSMTSGFNAITNAGTSFPPPNSYTGTTKLSGNSLSAYSGSIQLAVLNPDGTPLASPYTDEPNGMAPMTLDLGAMNNGNGTGVSSVDNIINYINQYYGAPQNKLELGNLNNVQLNVASNNVPDTGNKLSFNFNLSNISSNPASFYSGGYTVLDDQGNVVSSSTGGSVATAQPSLSIGNFQFSGTAGNDTATLTTSGANTLSNGDIIYLNQPSSNVNGVPASSLGGFFTVSNVSGNTFQITVAGAGAASTNGSTVAAPAGTTVNTRYAVDAAGQSLNTGANGNVTATITNNVGDPNPAYYTIRANIASVDANGNLVQSTASYRVSNNISNSVNTMVGATSATADGTLVVPQQTQPILKAELVDANGNPLPKVNNAYGTQQGYLKITAANGKSVAINELDSQQLGLPGAPNGAVSTNQGFSQYFGLNNFFTPPATANDNTNAAINMAVQANILSNPGLLSTGKLTLGLQPDANSSLPPNYTYGITGGDTSTMQKLAAFGSNQSSFASVGGMASSSTTFANYAGQIVAATSTNSTNATNAKNDSAALLTGFTQSAQQVSGVNLDQELANTVVYQNAYGASARVISVVAAMFNELINVIGQ